MPTSQDQEGTKLELADATPLAALPHGLALLAHRASSHAASAPAGEALAALGERTTMSERSS